MGHLPFKSSCDVVLLLLSLDDDEEEDMLSKESFNQRLFAKETHFLSLQMEVFSLTDVQGCGSHSNSSQVAVKQGLVCKWTPAAIVKLLRVCISEAYPHKRETNHGYHGCNTLFSQM